MLIELQRALLPEDMQETDCALCAQRFYPLAAVVAWVRGPDREYAGVACPSCTLYFGQRNPERFPSTEEYLRATQRYPEPVFTTPDDWERAAEEGTFEAEYLGSWLS